MNGESILYSAYSESGLLHSLSLLNSGPAVYLGDAKISTSSTRGTRSSEKQKNVQIREGVGSNALRTAGPVSSPQEGRRSRRGGWEQLKGRLYPIIKKKERDGWELSS